MIQRQGLGVVGGAASSNSAVVGWVREESTEDISMPSPPCTTPKSRLLAERRGRRAGGQTKNKGRVRGD